MSTTPVMHLELRISPLIFKKIRNGPNGILRSGAWRKLIHKKTWSQKSCGTVPLKSASCLFSYLLYKQGVYIGRGPERFDVVLFGSLPPLSWQLRQRQWLPHLSLCFFTLCKEGLCSPKLANRGRRGPNHTTANKACPSPFIVPKWRQSIGVGSANIRNDN